MVQECGSPSLFTIGCGRVRAVLIMPSIIISYTKRLEATPVEIVATVALENVIKNTNQKTRARQMKVEHGYADSPPFCKWVRCIADTSLIPVAIMPTKERISWNQQERDTRMGTSEASLSIRF